MASILFRPKGEKESIEFCCSIEMLPDFCAWDIICGFSIDDGFWNEPDPNEKGVAESRLFRELLKECFRDASIGTTIFIGDEKGGVADKYLFPYIPKRAFTIPYAGVKVRCKPMLSSYYHNPNSGNQVRHVIITTEKAKK